VVAGKPPIAAVFGPTVASQVAATPVASCPNKTVPKSVKTSALSSAIHSAESRFALGTAFEVVNVSWVRSSVIVAVNSVPL
jgi:hypothetical protein